jgi:hypothetical protein
MSFEARFPCTGAGMAMALGALDCQATDRRVERTFTSLSGLLTAIHWRPDVNFIIADIIGNAFV